MRNGKTNEERILIGVESLTDRDAPTSIPSENHTGSAAVPDGAVNLSRKVLRFGPWLKRKIRRSAGGSLPEAAGKEPFAAPMGPWAGRNPYQMIFERAGVGIALIEAASGRFLEANPALQQMLGFSRAELQSKTIASITWPAERDLIRNRIDRLLQNRNPNDQFEFRYMERRGRIVWGHLTLTPAFDSGRNSRQMVAILKDINDYKQIEQSITFALAQAEQARLRAEHLASTDCLTGLLNRQTFLERLRSEIGRCRCQTKPLSLILVDLDHFKQINDSFGHQTGDLVLRQFSACLMENCRSFDLVGRIGGEEFIVCLPGTPTDQAFQVAERLRRATEQLTPVLNSGAGQPKLTASFGVTTLAPDSDEEPDRLIVQADRAMYLAKQEGRNRVRFLELPRALSGQA